jgi:hypothetical protein
VLLEKDLVTNYKVLRRIFETKRCTLNIDLFFCLFNEAVSIACVRESNEK